MQSRKRLNFVIVLKADRLTYLLLLILLLPSCRDGNVSTHTDESRLSPQDKYVPDWIPPQLPSQQLYYMPSVIIVKAREESQQQEDEIIILIKRDTINGIPVRSSGSITFSEELPVIDEREQTEEAYYAISYISTNRYIGVNFDNDIFNNTDYYYTNGIRIEYIASIFASSPLSYTMLPYRKYSMNYHGMTFVQNMFTPTNPDTINVQDNDRPFAACLYLGHFKNTLSSKNRYRQYSELQVGLIGPGSLGGFVQDQIHDIPPLGWENQIQNDLVLNYTALVEKGLYNPGFLDLNVYAEGQLGTLYTNAGGGLRIRIGKLNPYFSMPGLATENSTEGSNGLKWQYGIFGTAKVKMVIYNATLQGGMINRSSNYTIPSEDIERFLLQASVGIYLAFKQLGVMYEQFYISPEFKNAYHFRWGHINMTYCF
ncbi:MAG: lipid A deacylase LpxR family protein [Bacteroidales bacterium]|nr:lipid A deacylase LpxR family protein [Bacteroidales bacterium]